jgi:DNA-binding transcriptional LysR family regulator
MMIDNLRTFMRVIDERSISKAAEFEHITQSGITQMIRKMETDLGCELLIRSNKGIEPTESGALVYEYAKKITDLDQSMKQRLVCMTEGCYSIVIKPCCSLDNSIIPNILFNIQNKFSNIKMNIELEDKERILNEVKSGVTDFGIFMGDMPKDNEVDITNVGVEHIVLIAGNQLIKQNSITSKELSNYKVIDFSLGSYASEVHAILSDLIYQDRFKKTYTPFFSIDSIPAIKSLVENNFGVSFIPLYSIQDDLNEGKFKIVNVENFKLTLPIRIVSKKDENLPPFLKKIRQYFIDSSKTYFKRHI